jgi:hypothetical protein
VPGPLHRLAYIFDVDQPQVRSSHFFVAQCSHICVFCVFPEKMDRERNEREERERREREERERKEREAEEEKCAALIRMAHIMREYQAMVDKGFEDLQKKYK